VLAFPSPVCLLEQPDWKYYDNSKNENRKKCLISVEDKYQVLELAIAGSLLTHCPTVVPDFCVVFTCHILTVMAAVMEFFFFFLM